MAFIRYIEVALSLVDRVVVRLIGISLLAMTVLLFVNSIGRAVLNMTFVGGPALGRLLMIWMTFMGVYLLVRTGRHVAIDITARMVSKRTLRWLLVVIGTAGGVTMGYVSWLGYRFTLLRFSFGQMDPMLQIPTGYFYVIIPLGCALSAISFFHNALKSLVKYPTQDHSAAREPIAREK